MLCRTAQNYMWIIRFIYLALRDLSLTFPVELADLCCQALQVLHDRLLERDKSTSKKLRENVADNRVASLLIAAREPLHVTAFGSCNDEVLYNRDLSQIVAHVTENALTIKYRITRGRSV